MVLQEQIKDIIIRSAALAPEARFIGIQAAIERIKLGALLIRFGIDCSGFAITFALYFLRFAIGICDDKGARLVGCGADFFRFCLAGGTQFVGHTRAFRHHPLVYGFGDAFGQIHAL